MACLPLINTEHIKNITNIVKKKRFFKSILFNIILSQLYMPKLN